MPGRDKLAEFTGRCHNHLAGNETFGLITTNSLRQTFNRSVVQAHLSAQPPLSLVFATPDQPWADTAEGAAVRIVMTVGVVR